MVVLDATAGNRMMWPDKNPPLTVFMDKEEKLMIPPDIFAVWESLPFRDSVFACVIFDPPHLWGKTGAWADPTRSDKYRKWYGFFTSRLDMVTSIFKAQEEFKRVTNRICLKWGETKISLWNILSLFKDWRVINRYKSRGRRVRGIFHRSGSSWWITLIRVPPKP